MSRPLRYAILGTLVALALGLAAWCILTGYHFQPTKHAQTPWLAVTTAITAALLAGRTRGRCRLGCKRSDVPQEQLP